MEYQIGSSGLVVSLTSSEISVNVGESAKIDVGTALNYIKSGEVEIDNYVNNAAKPAIDAYVDNTSKPAIDAYVVNTTEPNIDAYVTNTVLPQFGTYIDLAKDWATKTDGTVDGSEYSAKYYAEQAQTTLSSKQDILTADNAGTGISITGSGANVLISSTQTSSEWGNIRGNLPDQTDLQNALNEKQDALTPTQMQAVNSGANTTNIGQISTNTADIADIDALIPNQASTSNQLADKDFVNSSIATNTANFIGTFNSVAELEAYSGTLTNNDYAFVSTTDTAGNTLYDRYKWNGSEWLFEYELNNSSFTAVQWAAINSGVTSTNIGQIATNASDIADLQTNKQDVISDLSTIRSGAALGATSIQPSDLSTYVTTNTAQSINGLKTIKNQLKVQSGSGDGTLFIGADANKTTLTDNFRKVARVNMPTHEDITLPMTIISGDTSGDTGSTIGQKTGIWNRIEFGGRPGAKYNTSPDGMAFCVATSHNSTLNKVIALEMDATQARFNVQPNYNGANFATETYVNTGLATKQDTLVSGTNIKTINNQSILGSGNIDIQGGTDIEAFTAAEVQTIWNGVL